MLPASDQDTRQTTDGNLPDPVDGDQFAVEREQPTDLLMKLVHLLPV